MNLGNVYREYPMLVLKDGQDDNQPGDNKEGDGKEKEVTFTDAQQGQIQKIFDTRFSKITAKHETEKKALADENEQLKQRLAALESGDGKDGDNKDGDKNKDKYKDIIDGVENKRKNEELKRQAAEKERDEAKTEVMRIRKENAMAKAASKSNFYNVEDVLALTNSSVEYNDEYKMFVVKENGQIKENAKLEPMTLDEYYADFAAKRPYLVNGDMLGGANSTENGKSGVSSLGVVRYKSDLKTAKEKADYIDKFGFDAWDKLELKPRS